MNIMSLLHLTSRLPALSSRPVAMRTAQRAFSGHFVRGTVGAANTIPRRTKATAIAIDAPTSSAIPWPPATTSLSTSAPRPFTAIPALPSIPILGVIPELRKHDRSPKGNQFHLSQVSIHNQYGPLVRVRLPGRAQDALWIADPDMVAEVFRAEPMFPARPPIATWSYYREKIGYPQGIALSNGDEWKRIRVASQDLIFKPNVLQKNFTACVNAPTALLVSKIKDMLKAEGEAAVRGEKTVNVEDLIMRWSIEAVSNIILGKDLGALATPPIPIAERMIKAFNALLRTTGPMMRHPEFAWKYQLTASAREHFAALEEFHTVTNDLVKGVVGDFAKDPSKIEGTFLGHVLSRPDALSQQEMLTMAADFLNAGIDTTSRTALNIMYLLGQHPDVQRKLRDEIVSVVGQDGPVESHHLAQFKFFKNIIKETMRILPNFPGNSRLITKDTTIAGYEVPANTEIMLNNYVISMNPKYVKDPEKFMPERWDTKDIHSFASLPFGNGSRMCIGRRIAEMELHVLFAHLLRRMEVVPAAEPLQLECTLGIAPIGFTPLRFRPLSQGEATQ
ncbi:cytochrome P450 [Catenaria anguillulae PL171]|uniref:Cytochrome P450 n=1 Tax=Catenaria anguillulae PL171 TaxID=765915 RepID=A0A1Y2I1S6_9FUNG|nr:cytochrome P450 [Catenaria anguillulae PL171]